MAKRDREPEEIAALREQLLAWYGRNQRDLPWRRTQDPYAIWVSEIMLQQTRVAVVIERYQAFLARFPTIGSLAQAPEQDVLALWSGLGYYRRARMLHKAARFVMEQLRGDMPVASKALRLLPGIGAYTAAAIASIAHGEVVAVVDGNVERVLCRLSGWENDGGPDAASMNRRIERLAAQLVDRTRPGDFNQALMELGATVCLPRNPQCLVCPVAGDCKTRGEHKTQPRPRMLKREAAYALSVRDNQDSDTGREKAGREVLLEQRPASLSVMPGLWELPALLEPEFPEDELRMTVHHAIMQVNYSVRIRTVLEGDVDSLTVSGGERRWVALTEAPSIALTGLARKVLTRAHLLPTAAKSVIALEPQSDVL